MIKSRKIYMDYASSVSPNPSSIHQDGVTAKKKLQNAHEEVAKILNARKEEIIFTSGGTESNNLAIQGIIQNVSESQIFFRSSEKIPRPFKKPYSLPHIITTNIEHPSVLETCKMLEKRKLAKVSIVPVEPNGIVDPKKIKKEIKSNTILVSVMYANNEIGTIQPIKEIGKEIRHYRRGKAESFSNGLASSLRGPEKNLLNFRSFPIFHSDAVQAANYLDLNVEKLGVDMLSLSGSKIEGAGRVGVLYKKKSVPLHAIWGGGDQEIGLRPGTENLPDILKFSTALKEAQKIKEKESIRLIKLRDYFFEKLLTSQKNNFFGSSEKIPRPLKNHSFTPFVINGDLKERLPNNVNITIPNIPSDLLVIELSARGIMASAKSACKSGDGKVSHVIKAINKNIKETDGSLRFSFGRNTTQGDVDYTVKALQEILTKLKRWYN